MADDDKSVTSTTDVPTVHVVAVSQTGTADGLTLALQTPGVAPNLVVTYITPVVALLVRFITYFLTNLLGIVTTVSATGMIPFRDFQDLVVKSATIAVGGALISTGKDLLTLFTNISKKIPLLDA